MLELKPERFELAEAISRPVTVCGVPLIADNSGALYWPGQSALLVADLLLHGSPAGHVRQTLVKLAEVMDRYQPARVIVFADGTAEAPAEACWAAEDVEVLRILQESNEWIWLTGTRAGPIAAQLGGSARAELELAGLALRPRATPGWATHEIGAAMRPAAHLSMYGYAIRRACFVGNGRRLVMPAFGAPTAGRNVLDDAFRPLFGDGGMSVWLLGEEGLYPVATRLLADD
jgi:hypothetical protein